MRGNIGQIALPAPDQSDHGGPIDKIEMGHLPDIFYAIGYRMVLDATPGQGRAHVRNRLYAMLRLGGKCCKCGFSDPRALQIDHVNGLDGEPRRTSQQISKDIIGGRAPAGYYQLLCANCNWIKRHECHETRSNHQGERIQEFRNACQKQNTEVIREFRWPKAVGDPYFQGEDIVNLLYLIAEERRIDPTTIPGHKQREHMRRAFNRPYGHVRPKTGSQYLDPVAHIKTWSQQGQ